MKTSINFLSDKVYDKESLARYLLEKSKFSRTTGRVKHRAFLPPRDLRLSVFRTQGMSCDEVQKMGEESVAEDRTLYGWASLAAQSVRSIDKNGLAVEPDPPPDRHASIEGWPEDKNEQMLRALQLASIAKLRVVRT